VESVARRLIGALRHGGVDASTLDAAGLDEPAALAEALAEAAADSQLGEHLEVWMPPLLASAQPLFGVRTLRQLVTERRGLGQPIHLPQTPALPALLGASRFLGRRLLAHPEWIDGVAGSPPEAPPAEEIGHDWEAIRCAKYRGLLRIAARDLLGRPFEQSLQELSDLADRCLVAALACAEEESGTPAPALLALGKLGGRELNFSSDVDLLFVYDIADGRDPIEAADQVARLVRRLKSSLERPTEEGFGYRVDLDLRPEGRAGVLANPVDAALSYYESFGVEWERQMLIRLRPVAGPEPASRRFCGNIVPFVYRGLIGPDVMHSVRDMKQRIESDRRAAGRDLEASLKEGPGGIRDVEFLVQAFQLLHGGREPRLRSGNVLQTLDSLRDLELLPPPTVRALRDAYLWLRRAEHALQLAEERQTSRVPREPAAQTALARRMGYSDAEASAARTRFLDDWTAVRSEVRTHFEDLTLGSRE
jgi:glutamate-ammonia-ligase adenylyltransferase